jgi:hypothetical protein
MSTTKDEIRQIAQGWLIVGPNGPLLLTVDKDKAVKTFTDLQENVGDAVRMTTITIHVDRFKEIGRNLIQRKLPQINGSVMDLRNRLVLETHERGSWEMVRRAYALPEMTYEEMNQWLMDHMRYNTRELD